MLYIVARLAMLDHIVIRISMNIYHCYRDFSGFGLTAIVEAKTESEAQKELGWEIDEDTLEITIKVIGEGVSSAAKVWSEESF